jgi:hypothetical protein
MADVPAYELGSSTFLLHNLIIRPAKMEHEHDHQVARP